MAKRFHQLHLALAEESGIEKIDTLLAAGADVNAEDENGETALFCAVKRNCDLGVIKALLKAGGDVRCKAKGDTLLHVVDSADVIKELLSHGVSVNKTNMDRETPLHSAVKRKGGIELVDSLLAAGARVNAMDSTGGIALFCAVENNSDLGVIKALLKGGGDVNCRVRRAYKQSLDGTSIFHSLVSEISKRFNDESVLIPLYCAIKRARSIEMIECLLAAGADVNAVSAKYTFSLFSAVNNKRDKWVIKALLNGGRDVNCRVWRTFDYLLNETSNFHRLESKISERFNDESVLIPLYCAIKRGRSIEMIECLLAAGADVNAVSATYKTALFSAVDNNGDTGVILALLKAGGDVNCKDLFGNTLLHVARSADLVRELLSRGVSPNNKNKADITPLHTAVMFSNIEVVQSLLAAGANVNAVDADMQTPLHFAVIKTRQIKLIECLLDADADVNAKDKYKRTALYYAAYYRDLRVFRALLMAGGDVHCKDFAGNSLFFAVHEGEVAKELLSHGLHIDGVNNYGFTPLGHVAFRISESSNAMPHKYDCPHANGTAGATEDGGVRFSCNGCRYFKRAWTLILNGAAVISDGKSPLEILLRKRKFIQTSFFLMMDLMKRHFDCQEGAIDLSSYRNFFNKLKMRGVLNLNLTLQLSRFVDECVREIDCMKCDMINDNLSLYNHFFKCEKNGKIFPLYLSNIKYLKEIPTKYSIYHELIRTKIIASVRKSILFDQLKGLKIYVKKSWTEEISLRYDILRQIAEYLSFSDMNNLIKCAVNE